MRSLPLPLRKGIQQGFHPYRCVTTEEWCTWRLPRSEALQAAAFADFRALRRTPGIMTTSPSGKEADMGKPLWAKIKTRPPPTHCFDYMCTSKSYFHNPKYWSHLLVRLRVASPPRACPGLDQQQLPDPCCQWGPRATHTEQEDAGSTGRGLHKEQREVTAWGERRTRGAISLVHGQSCCVQTPFTAVVFLTSACSSPCNCNH